MNNKSARAEYMKRWNKNNPYGANPTIKSCERCGKAFKPRYGRKSIRFCSISCAMTSNTFKNCTFCGKQFKTKPSHYERRLYCSRLCSGSSKTGENAPNWQGGKTIERTRIMSTLAYKKWRLSVFKRDGFKCVWCGDGRGGNLEADHIKPWAFYPELRLDVDNGRTLCVDCHKQTDTWGKKVLTFAKANMIPESV